MIHINIKCLCADSVQPTLKLIIFVFTDGKQIRNCKDCKCRYDYSLRKESQGMYFDIRIQQTNKSNERYCEQPILRFNDLHEVISPKIISHHKERIKEETMLQAEQLMQ